MNPLESLRHDSTRMHFVLKNEVVPIKVKGNDRVDFLNRICSQKILGRTENEILPSALLNANGTVKVAFHFQVFPNHVTLFCERNYEPKLLAALDAFHFGESIDFERAETGAIAEVRGVEGAAPGNGFEIEPWRYKDRGISRFWCFYGSTAEALNKLANIRHIENDLDNAYRISWGRADLNSELGDGNIILEGPFDDYVHRNKGCYPGQEVIERIYTYGNVAKRIVPFYAQDSVPNANVLVGSEIWSDDAGAVGSVMAVQSIQNVVVGLAVIKRLSIEKAADKRFVAGGSRDSASVNLILQS